VKGLTTLRGREQSPALPNYIRRREGVEVSVGDLSDYWPTLRLRQMNSQARIAVDKYETARRPFSAS
jgi:hypothetical protein